MGRGIVHPVDAMHTEPWSPDLLDWLAADFAAHDYNLKHTIALIATSDIYQSQTPPIDNEPDADDYIFRGPHARRLTAEQFVDCVWQLTDTAPTKTDAPVVRAALHQPDAQARGNTSSTPVLSAHWIWSSASPAAPANQTLTFRRQFKLKSAPSRAVAVITCDNEYRLLVNGREIESDDNWETVELVSLDSATKVGDNEILVVAKNTGNSPNAAGLIFQTSIQLAGGEVQTIATDENWQWTTAVPDARGRFPTPPANQPDAQARAKYQSTPPPKANAKAKRQAAKAADAPAGSTTDWQPAVVITPIPAWTTRVGETLPALLHQAASGPIRTVRASLLKSNDLMRALGRPNRDQIVSMRPADLTTLEAISLANGETLATTIEKGAAKWQLANGEKVDSLVARLYLTALSRPPTIEEQSAAINMLSQNPTNEDIQDLLWSAIMLPEFQLVR
jgi:hypothetical protein